MTARRTRIGSALLCLALVLCLSWSGAYAWRSMDQTARNDLVHVRETVPVTLRKLERDLNGRPTERPVRGAEFYLYTQDGAQIGGAYTTDALGQITLRLKPGNYYFLENYPGPGYGFDLDGGGEPITKYPFTVAGDEERVTVKVYDRRLAGPLVITKTVTHPDGSPPTPEEREKTFLFEVTFSDGGRYFYRIDGGPEMMLESGGVIGLRHGQTARFSALPVGVQYTVTERPAEGYSVSSAGGHGNITPQGQTAEFTNTPGLPPVDRPVLAVTKVLEGEYPPEAPEKEFHFTLTVNGVSRDFTLRHGETMEFTDLAFGDRYTVTETDVFPDGYSLHTAGASGTVSQARTEATFTNTYVDRPQTEVSGEKTWEVDDAHRDLIPASITVLLYDGDRLAARQTVAPDGEGRWRYTFSVPKYAPDGREIVYTVREEPVDCFAAGYNGYNILNTYVPPTDADPPILEKVVEGAGAPTRRFEFVLVGEEGAPMPAGSTGSTKQVALDGGGHAEFGSITFRHPGVYPYQVYELTESGGGWTCDDARYTVTFTVTAKDGGLAVERTLTRNGESAGALVFRNRYDPGGPIVPTPTSTPTPTPTASPSPTVTPTPSASGSPTPAAPETPAPGESPSATPTPAPEMTAPSPSPPAPSPTPTPPNVAQTGDTGELTLWRVLTAVAGVGAAASLAWLVWHKHRYTGKRLEK